MSLWIKAAYSQFSPALQSLAAKSTQKNIAVVAGMGTFYRYRKYHS